MINYKIQTDFSIVNTSLVYLKYIGNSSFTRARSKIAPHTTALEWGDSLSTRQQLADHQLSTQLQLVVKQLDVPAPRAFLAWDTGSDQFTLE